MAGSYWYVRSKPAKFEDFAQWKHVELDSKLKPKELEDKLADLGDNGLYRHLIKSGDLIYFRDKPTFRSWGNEYVLDLNPAKRYLLYFRGNLIKFRIYKNDLSNTIRILNVKP